MGNIAEYLRTLRTAVFGKDVRESIAKSIEQTYEDATRSGNANMEVSDARGYYSSLKNRLDGDKNDLQSQINGLASGSPLVASSVSGMTNTNRVYVNTTDGHWYTYNGSTWVDGGVYQARGIEDNSVTLPTLASDAKFNLNSRINDKDSLVNNNYYLLNLVGNLVNKAVDNNGELSNNSEYRVATTNLIYVDNYTNIELVNQVNNISITIYYFDKNFNLIKTKGLYNRTNLLSNIICTNNASYIRLRFEKTNDSAITPQEVLDAIQIKFTKMKDDVLRFKIKNNMIDDSTSINGYMPSASNVYAVTVSSSYRTTKPIKIKKNTNYFINKFRKFALLDENFNYVSDSFIDYGASDYTFSVNYDGYVLLSYAIGDRYSVIMNEGTEASPYEPYKILLPDNVDLSNIVQFQNILYNKKYVACGDSFTEGDFRNSVTNDYIFNTGKYIGKKKVYPYFIGNRNDMTVVNEAVSGSTMTYIEGESYCFSQPNGRYTKIPSDADYITLKFGINDGNRNVEIGTIDDDVNTTFYGAWNIVLDYIIRNHPNAKIGIIVTNGSNLNIVNATINIARKWGIPYLNEATGEQVPLLIRTNKDFVSSDIKSFRNHQWVVNDTGTNNNWHPNEKCHEYESTIVENWLRTL